MPQTSHPYFPLKPVAHDHHSQYNTQQYVQQNHYTDYQPQDHQPTPQRLAHIHDNHTLNNQLHHSSLLHYGQYTQTPQQSFEDLNALSVQSNLAEGQYGMVSSASELEFAMSGVWQPGC
jgi:hypothetical protein